MPVIAVAAGSSIFYFKDFAPHMTYDLPMIEFSEQESQIWGELIKITSRNTGDDATESSQEIDVQTMPQLLERLFSIRESNQGTLSYMSARLLALEN